MPQMCTAFWVKPTTVAGSYPTLQRCLNRCEDLPRKRHHSNLGRNRQSPLNSSNTKWQKHALWQEQDGVWTAVCYANRSLTEWEQRHSQTEKEALGVARACERFHAYVYGMKFVLETDHKPLEVIYGPRSRPCARIERCVAGELCVIGQLLLRGTRIVIPKKLQRRTRAPAHEGHLGVVGTKQNLRTSKGWWPGMDKAADRHCRACHVDLMVPLPSGHSLLVIVDYYIADSMRSRSCNPLLLKRSSTAWQTLSVDMGYQSPSSPTMVHSLSGRATV